MRRLWAVLLLTLPAFAWAESFDSGAFDSTNSFDTGAFDFVTGVCGVDDNSPIPGTTITVSGCPAFAGAITHLTGPEGNIINAEAGATTTSASFIIPSTAAFVSGGSMQFTEWSVDGNWVVDDGSETNLTYTMRIDPPGTSGPDHWFGTVTTPAGDSVFPAEAVAGDEYYVSRVSGTSVSVNSNGSTSAASDYELNATIWDESANAGAGAWSTVENTVFDSTPPAFVSAVIASNGTTFTLTLDEDASQGVGYSDSNLTLSASGGAATLVYASGNGTTAHVYTVSRTIEPGETVTVSWTGTVDGLEDAVGNDVAAFSGESVTNNSSSDVTPPAYVSSAIDTAGTLFTLTTDEAITQGAGYADSDLTLSCDGGAATLTYSAGNGTTTPDYTISRTIEAGETCTIAFDGSANSLEDAAGNDLAAFSGQSTTNNSTADVTAPSFASAAIGAAGTSITITFDESVVFGAGGNGGFAIASCSGGAVTPTYSSGSGSANLVYTLSRTVGSHETGCTVAYTQPTNGAEDAAGNDVVTFGAQAVANNSTQDLVAPTVTGAQVAATVLTISHNESVTHGAGGTGGTALTCSGGAVTPTYASGAGSTQLVHTLSREILGGETCTLAYTQPTNGVEDLVGNDLVTLSGRAVTVRSGCVQLTGPVINPVVGPSVLALQCAQ